MRATLVAVTIVLICAPFTAGAECELGWLDAPPTSVLYPHGGSLAQGVEALAWYDDGSGLALYAGGDFLIDRAVEPTLQAFLVKWDGWRWTPVAPDVFQGPVMALRVRDGKLLVACKDAIVGTSLVTGIVAWDGTTCSVVVQCDEMVYALGEHDGDLVFGGDFAHANGVMAGRIAHLHGASVLPYGAGLWQTCYALAELDGDLVAAGVSEPVRRWNGTSWTSLGATGSDGWVHALAVHGGQLYAGGYFSTIGGSSASGIARWTGSTWQDVSGGVGGPGRSVDALTSTSQGLLVGGEFTTAGGLPCASIALWDGGAWSALGDGLDNVGYYYAGGVNAILATNDRLIVGGDLYFLFSPGCMTTNVLAEWDGAQWGGVQSGVTGGVRALAAGSGHIGAGGVWLHAGQTASPGVGELHGDLWSGPTPPLHAVGYDCELPIGYAVATEGANTYFGGQFTHAGDEPLANIGRWDGQSWHSLADGLSSTVLALTWHDGQLVAGGRFTTAGAVPAHFIAAWNGTSWSAIGDGFNFHVKALLSDAGQVYAGGSFTMSGTTSLQHIARWDGSQWQPLGSGIGGDVLALASYNGRIIATGSFAQIDGVTVNGIAAWDGSTWQALGSGLDDGVGRALAVYRGDLYVGGTFLTAGGIPVHHIARWDGTQWHALGSGVTQIFQIWDYASVYALAVADDALLVGGDFWTAGDQPRNYFARWGCTGPALCPGDVNCDASVDFADIDPFVEALGYPGGAGWPHTCPWLNADCNSDQSVDFADIDPFVALIGQVCP